MAADKVSTPLISQCRPVTVLAAPVKKFDLAQDEVVVTSKKSDLIKDKLAQFQGDVIIHQENQTIKADSAIFNEQTSQFMAQGNVQLNAEAAQVTGESILVDEENKEFQLQQAKYQLGFNAGRGKAGSFSIKQDSELVLANATSSRSL